jgi:Na+/H+ antiporter NhaC
MLMLLKWILGILLFIASLVGGAIVGSIVGAIYAPVKLYQVMTGSDQKEEIYMDDEI